MLKALLELLTGGSGIASAVTNGVKWTAIAASLPLLYSFFIEHKNDVLVTLDTSQALLVLGIIFAMIQVAHSARGPNRNND